MLNRLTYGLTFRVATLLHIGDGMQRRERDPQNDTTFEIATISKDEANNPWMPGSTLKGAFRAVAKQIDCEDAAKLFGRAHEEGGADIRGALSFDGAVMESSPKAVLVRKQTRIHRGTGTSEANLLFAREYVEVGSEFRTTVTLQCRQDPQELSAAFEAILARFMAVEGVPIGSGKSDHLGAIRLSNVTCKASELTKEGWQAGDEVDLDLEPAPSQAPLVSIYCACPGMYLSKYENSQQQDKSNRIQPEAGPDGLPRMLTTGVSGYLRTRAEWLTKVYYGAGGKTPQDTVIECKTSAGQKPLDVVQRLFGDEGYRARLSLRVSDIKASKATQDNPHVALDQLTHAPFDGALLVVEAHHSVSFQLHLNTWAGELRADERALVSLLEKDIAERGLMLGMGTSKGYGWFNCEATEAAEWSPKPVPAREPVTPDERPIVTLPYRFAEANLNHIGMPQTDVAEAYANNQLHNKPFEKGNSGFLDVSWLFDTPVLIGGMGEVRSPQKIGGKYVIPGATIRGAIRAGVEAAVNARLTRVTPLTLKYGDERSKAPFLDVQNQLLRPSTPDDANPHRPSLDENFVPDFAAAMFGFVGLGDDDTRSRKHLHQNLHLKSRVSFGTAWHVNEHNRHKERNIYRPYRAAPDPSAIFYDHSGRKQYIATQASRNLVADRLGHEPTKNEEQNNMQFLHPTDKQPLIFRQRIAFHNLTDTELGALCWVLFLGYDLKRRHRIGNAKAFGAGRSRVHDLNLIFTHDHCGERHPATEGEKGKLGSAGYSILSYGRAFQTYLTGLHEDIAHGRNEYLQAADPAIGQGMRNAASLSPYDLGYQTAKSLDKKAQEKARARTDNRLAAMLRKAPRV